MCSLIDSTRVGIVDERRLKHRAEVFHDRVVNNPVTHGGFMDVPELRVVDKERDIRRMCVGLAFQRFVELPKVVFEVSLEGKDVRLVFLADAKFAP
jgi:hypothetical protein